MTKFTDTGDIIEGTNRIPSKESYIYVGRLNDARQLAMNSSQPPVNISWTKYQIKETDMRIKTATFSSPQYMDLTTGRFRVLIASPYHENFMGLILSVEYDEDKEIYNYQCQDWSRNYMSKRNMNANYVWIRNIIWNMLTKNSMTFPIPTNEELENYAVNLSGIRPLEDYDQEKWGSTIKFNPLNTRPDVVIRDKPEIEVIRDLVYGSGGYIDLWWNERGILQVEPYSKDDFFGTGLHLVRPEAIDRKFKFDTTNIITGAVVRNSEEKYNLGSSYWNETLLNFFGYYDVASSDKELYANLGNTVTSTNDTKSTSSPSTGSFKGRKIWINADNGSDSMKHKVADLLKNRGYTVHVSGTGPSYHYSDYTNVGKDYVYITLYNGFCAGTIREAYSSSIQNKLKNKNVQLVIMFDTQNWTNPQGMKPYRYGDFTGYNAKRAWDDNFSSSDPSIKNVSDYLKKNNAVYCASPTAEGLVEQFEAGGYFKYKGIT